AEPRQVDERHDRAQQQDEPAAEPPMDRRGHRHDQDDPQVRREKPQRHQHGPSIAQQTRVVGDREQQDGVDRRPDDGEHRHRGQQAAQPPPQEA
ncbi:hypothetical protein ADS78_12910, partial [Idiomarina abyssalis]